MTIYHRHHIIPRHMGGTDDPENIQLLSIEEHAEAHRKLYEEYGKLEDLWAYNLLSSKITIQEGFSLLLTKNAYDTHNKCKENRSGFWSSKQQKKNGIKGAIKANIGGKNNANKIRISCIICRREIGLPNFNRHYHTHLK